jgi:hypothetical protein
MKWNGVFALLMGLMIFTGACASSVKTDAPFTATALEQATESRLRTAKLYRRFDTILVIDIIQNNDALVSLWADEAAAARLLSPAEKAALALPEAERLIGHHEFIIAAYTHEDRWNDFDDPLSRWSITLDTGSGPIHPATIKTVKLEKLFLSEALPFDPRFRKFYRVQFVIQPEERRPFTFAISSTLGSASLMWDE